jgi:hypothetical protein
MWWRTAWQDVLSALAREELFASVEPRAAQKCAGRESRDAVGAWPGAWRGKKTLFRAVGQNVANTSVRSFLVGDDDGAVAARPQTLAPEVKASGLLGDVGIHELHEQRKLAGAGG